MYQAFKEEEEDYTLLDVSDKCKDLAAHLHKSPVAKLLLDNECGKVNHFPKNINQANDTRWDSRCTNMEDVLYHEKCLMSLASQGKMKVKPREGPAYSLVPTFEEFRMISAGVEALKIPKRTTKVMEQEKCPTMPLVTQRIYDMQAEMDALIGHDDTEEVARDFCQVLKERMEDRFPNFGTDIWLNCFGNYLNPCCKGVHLKLVKKFESTKDAMEEKLKVWKKEPAVDVDTNDVQVENTLTQKLSPTELLKQQMKEKEMRGVRTGGRRRLASTVFEPEATKLVKEMKAYEEVEDAEEGSDLLEWWKNHQAQFPLLSYMARVVFAVPASSSKSERVFSAAGLVVTPLRNRLDPEKVEDLLMIKLNNNLLKQMGRWKG